MTEPARGGSGAHVPAWLRRLSDAARDVRAEDLSRFLPPDDGGRESAVLVLFGESRAGPDVLLIERAHDMRSHAGQVAFPGGALDPGEGPVEAALREAVEETGLDPAGVEAFATLPDLWLPPSGFVVTPVLAWWRRSSPVSAVDPAEVASVHRISIAEIARPSNRLRVRHAPTGYVGAAFRVRGLLVWGFTAGLLDRLLVMAGWEEPWEPAPVEELPAGARSRARLLAQRADEPGADPTDVGTGRGAEPR